MPIHTGLSGTWAQSVSSPRGNITQAADRADAEQRRAATGYLFWPAALYEQFVDREPASSWYRLQIRQAVRFGARSAVIALAALLWPLLAALAFGNVAATLVLYGVAIVLDCVLLALWLRSALRFSKRARRGETFEIPSLRFSAARRLSAKH